MRITLSRAGANISHSGLRKGSSIIKKNKSNTTLKATAYYILVVSVSLPQHYSPPSLHRVVNLIQLGGGVPLCILHRAEGLYGWVTRRAQGVYERFLIKNLIRYTPATQEGLYTVQERAPLVVLSL